MITKDKKYYLDKQEVAFDKLEAALVAKTNEL